MNRNFLNAMGTELSPHFHSYRLRNRQVQNVVGENHDSFSSKQAKRKKLSKLEEKFNAVGGLPYFQTKISLEIGKNCSQESVSMLQECYDEKFPELTETCLDSQLETINIINEEEIELFWDAKKSEKNVELDDIKITENYTQTDFSIFQNNLSTVKGLTATKHSNFIGSIIKLKHIMSSKNNISNESLSSILQNTSYAAESASLEISQENNRKQMILFKEKKNISKEAIGYLLRSADAENVFLSTVQALLLYLEQELNENLDHISCFWENSVYQMAVDMINQAVDSDSQVRQIVDFFLYKTIGSVLENKGRLKNLGLESKAMFILKFCQSTHLTYVAIDYIIDKIKCLAVIKHEGEFFWPERLSWSRITKNTYFLLRVLEDLLKMFKTKLEEHKIEEEVIGKKLEVKNVSVLEMWKKRWSGEEETKERKNVQHCYKISVSKWSEVLDDILMHCIKHVMVLSMAVERCRNRVKKIVKICHPEVSLTQK